MDESDVRKEQNKEVAASFLFKILSAHCVKDFIDEIWISTF